MDRIDIDTWANISAEGWSSLLLGNGASIAIHKEFSYPTLHSVADAKWLLATTAPIFAKLGTTDFEHVLLACWYAEHVNVALGTPSADISAAYAEVRKALIEAVHSMHPVHADVAADLQRAGTFASSFPTGVSLNYDLTLYWAMLLFNAANGSWFKDAFHHGEFQTDWGICTSHFPPLQAPLWCFTLTAVYRWPATTLAMKQRLRSLQVIYLRRLRTDGRPDATCRFLLARARVSRKSPRFVGATT